MENNTTSLLTIFDTFVRPYVRESQLRISAPTNSDQVKKKIHLSNLTDSIS
jgi:hypothetical protein